MRVVAAAVMVVALFGVSGISSLVGLQGIEHGVDARVDQDRNSEVSAVPSDTSGASSWTVPDGIVQVDAAGLSGTGQWMDLVMKASQESGVPWQILIAIMSIESGGNQFTKSPVGAVGLMQVMPQHWQETANRWGSDLWDPWVNIRTAADILTQNYLRWGSWEQAAAAYFGAIDGQGNVTGAVDAHGTSGHDYLNRFTNNLVALGFNESNGTANLLVAGVQVSSATQDMLAQAMSALGTPYVWGGASEGGFDCSGLVVWAYQQVGVSVPRTAAEQFNATARIEQADLLPGDLVFFKNTSGPGITHVGIYVGDGHMLNAPAQNEVVQIESISSPYWSSHIAGFGRVASPA